MTKRIIVADDSQTIQKVIKISFASKGYELIPCLSEAELFKNLSSDSDLILLDFSLSESKSGYDLAKMIREKSKSPILALLGTFDSVDEGAFLASGFSDKIVKPFETEKFLKKCESLFESSFEDVDKLINQGSEESEDYSGWDIQSPDINDASVEEEQISAIEVQDHGNDSKLAQELGGWGFDKSDLVARDLTNDFDVFPPVIEDTNKIATKFLSANSLVEDESVDAELNSELHLLENESTEEDNESHDLTGEIVINDIFNTDESASEEEIKFSENDVDALDFWSVDESSSNEEVRDTHFEKQDIEEEPLEFNYKIDKAPTNTFSNDEMMSAIKADITPIVEKYVKQYCEANIEKIMWEIIPDLAENIIKKEIKEISKNIQASIDN